MKPGRWFRLTQTESRRRFRFLGSKFRPRKPPLTLKKSHWRKAFQQKYGYLPQ